MDVCRLFWSESDGLPGLIIDKVGVVCIIQVTTLGIDKRIDDVVAALETNLSPEEIILKNDIHVREIEGCELYVRNTLGQRPKDRWVSINDIQWKVDFTNSQKTGMYLDQIHHHRIIASYAKGRDILDVCCHEGGFSLNAALNGAKKVLGIDSSNEAIKKAIDNAAKNKLQAEFECSNAFDFIKERRGEKWDMIILDPPSFSKSKETLGGAMRGYKELHLRALQILQESGILVTFTCSHHISWELLQEIIFSAALDAGKELRVMHRLMQPPDHPVLLSVPETEYLRGFMLEVVGKWK